MRLKLSAALVVLAASAVAQEPQPAPPRETAAQQPQPEATPAAAEPSEAQAEPEYGGPTILSRGALPSIGRGQELLRLRPFLTLTGIYSSGLASISTNAQGDLRTSNSYGVMAGFGVSGRHQWRRTALDLDYYGSARHYSQSSYQDGVDHRLILGVQHQLSPRLALMFQQGASRYQHAGFMLNDAWQSSDPLVSSMTAGELFDTPTYMLDSTAQLVYQRTARLSFSGGGGGMLVRRHSRALVGASGAMASGDVAYRLSRFQTLAVEYNFDEFRFTRQFGSSWIHGAALDYSLRIGRYWEINLRAGGFRVEASREHRVQLDPAVAAILGVGTGVEVYHAVTYLPRYDAHITRRFRRASLSGDYSRSVTPGNGVYLTSGAERVGASFSYFGLRRLSFNLGGGSMKYLSLGQAFSGAVGNLRSYYGSAAGGYRLVRSLSLTAGASATQSSVARLDRTFYEVHLGLAWSPGEYPIALW